MPEINRQVVMPKKVPKIVQSSVPATRVDKGSDIPRTDAINLLHNHKVQDLRNQGRTIEAIRKLGRTQGTTSTAIYNLVEIADSGFKVTAYNTADHQYSEDGTQLAASITSSFDTLFDYTEGYADKATMAALVEQSLLEVVLTGALCGELVLDKQRLPDRVQIVPWETITWKSRGDGRKYPVQKEGTNEIDLDLANFWISESHKEASVSYGYSMLEAALDTSFYFTEFIEDMRRVVRRSGHSRLHIQLDAEKVQAFAPAEDQGDPKKMQAFMERIRDEVETVVSSLEPEDALITYDSVKADSMDSEGEKADYRDLLGALSGMLSTSLKTNPSILGLRLTGSQSLSNTESLVYLKIARAIQKPVEWVLSRALTLAARLYGADIYVKFEFNTINLRPDDELEAFKVMRQDRILELLSLGFLSDEQAARSLGSGPRPAGAPPLSGTMFHESTVNKEPSPNEDPQGRALQPDTPKRGGGESQ